MTTKVKGLIKGLRYISQIFENEKEEEMQIGFPTDVKHVAHIGWEGPSVNSAPSWMNEFKSTSSGVLQSAEEAKADAGSKSPPHDQWPQNSGEKSKVSKRNQLMGIPSPVGSPRKRDKPKHSRRHHSSGGSVDCPARETTGSSRGRRYHSSNLGIGSPTRDSPAREKDLSSTSKHSRRRKSKGSNSSGSSRKGQRSTTDPFLERTGESACDPMDGPKNRDVCSNALARVGEEG